VAVLRMWGSGRLVLASPFTLPAFFMLRSFGVSLLSLALLTQAAAAQTTPAASSSTYKKTTTTKKTAAPRTVSNTTPEARRADPLRGTNDDGVGQSGYAAPGEPITTPSASGKNTATYDGKPAKPAAGNTSLGSPK
jgi:hypothetical protein